MLLRLQIKESQFFTLMNKSRGSLGKTVFTKEYEDYRQLSSQKPVLMGGIQTFDSEYLKLSFKEVTLLDGMNQENLANYKHQCQFQFLGNNR